MDSDYPWFFAEQELLNTIQGVGNKLLSYNKLFIEGRDIEGFPPSKQMIHDVLADYDIHMPTDAYQTFYTNPTKETWNIPSDAIRIMKYDKDTLRDACLLCTKHNAFLAEGAYSKENWSQFEEEKHAYLSPLIQSKRDPMLGFTAYYDKTPIGFIEAYKIPQAAIHGFPVSDKNNHGLMITCLNIRYEAQGNGVANKLIESIIKEAHLSNYKTIEVLAYPDNIHWHPKSLYKKHGFVPLHDIKQLTIMQKTLND